MKTLIKSLMLLVSLFCFLQTIQATNGSKVQQDSIYIVVDEMPQFPEGSLKMLKYLYKNIQLDITREEQVSNQTTTVIFVVTKTGKLKDIKAIRNEDSKLAEALIKVVEKMPLWTPAILKGQAVDAYYTLPFHMHYHNLD